MSVTIPPPRQPSSRVPNERVYDEDELDLREILLPLWGRKILIASITILVGLIVVACSYLVQRRYEAATVFVAATDDPASGRMGGLGALASQMGGLASLAGISLSGGDRKAEYLAILQSQLLIEQFIGGNSLVPVLFEEDWDVGSASWKDADPKDHPTPWKAMRRFKSKVMRLTTDSKTGLSTLTIQWSDPETSARWANQLVALGNDYVRSKAIAEAERNIVYLNEQLSKTAVVAVQGSISSLLEGQIKQVMLASGNHEYAFRVIDPAIAPEKASFPNRAVWAFFGCFVGLLGSSAWVLMRRREHGQ